MRKILTVFIFASLLAPLPAAAQKPVKMGSQIVKKIQDNTAQKIKSASIPLTPAPNKATAAAIKKVTQKIKAKRPALLSQKDGHVFTAVVEADPNMRFSGTVFEIEYNGKKEIYGAVATHIIPSDPKNVFGIPRYFNATVYLPKNKTPGKISKNKQAPAQEANDAYAKVTIPAEIVAAFPVSTFDVALVKFSEEGEKLLTPFALAQRVRKKENLHSVGYNHWQFTFIPQRHILKKTPTTIYTSMPLSHLERVGMCGSAVLTPQNELAGIHTGSRIDAPFSDNVPTVSYVTPASYLRFLIKAYHNGGQAKVPFYLAPGHFIKLDISEYPISFQLLGENNVVLFSDKVHFHFPHTYLSQLLKQFPQSRFLRLNTHRVTWANDAKALLMTPNDQPPYRTYLYDVQTRKAVNPSASNRKK